MMLRAIRTAGAAVAQQRRGFSVTAGEAGQRPSVGFIGLGNMGAHMARNLQKAGYPLVVNDVNVDITGGFAKDGALVAKTPAEVADNSQIIITMLPSNPHVKAVYEGADGIFSAVQEGSMLIDASTIDPAVAQAVGEQAKARGALFVDAPVSGGVGGAEAGTLTFMVGGEQAAYDSATHVLDVMGGNIVHCGGVGTGQGVKICNNMMLAISMIGTSETMNLGVKLGIDPKLLAGVLNTSSGRSWSSDTYNPCPGVMDGVPASRGYTGGFGTALMAKDLGLAMSAAADAKAVVPLGALSNQIYTIMAQQGYATKDFSSAFEYLSDTDK